MHLPRSHRSESSRAQRIAAALSKGDWRRSLVDGVDREQWADPMEPTQVKLSFVPSGMAVSWATLQPYQSPNAPRVAYGTNPNVSDLLPAPQLASLMCESDADPHSPLFPLMLSLHCWAQSLYSLASSNESTTYGTSWFHTVVISPLSPSSLYYYQVQGSPIVRSFLTAPRVGSQWPFTALVVGDMGLVNSADTMARMQEETNSRRNDFVMHVGDISYADDFFLRPNSTYEGSWDQSVQQTASRAREWAAEQSVAAAAAAATAAAIRMAHQLSGLSMPLTFSRVACGSVSVVRWQDLMQNVTSQLPYMTLPGSVRM